MNIRKTLLVGLVATPLALVGCQTETEYEVEPDGTVSEIDRGIGVDDQAIDNTLDNTGQNIEEGLDDAGNAIDDAGNVIDDNVDLGDNAGTPEVDQ